jgi:hypothetical protein
MPAAASLMFISRIINAGAQTSTDTDMKQRNAVADIIEHRLRIRKSDAMALPKFSAAPGISALVGVFIVLA